MSAASLSLRVSHILLSPEQNAHLIFHLSIVLNNIRTIKLLGWEPEQDRSVEKARTEELHEARKEMTVLIGVELIKYVARPC